MQNRFEIENPLVVVFEGPDKELITHINPGNHSYEGFGLLIADVVRHTAKAFKVDEDAVWAWVDEERFNPTTKITQAS